MGIIMQHPSDFPLAPRTGISLLNIQILEHNTLAA